MLIARITGGIGNQLFQYAFVRSLSIKFNKKFKLDLSWYRDYDKYEESINPNAATKREYLLDKFNITENLLNRLYLSISYRLNNYPSLKKITNYPLIRYFSYKTITESDFDIERIDNYNNIYLNGFWQNSNLLEEYRDTLEKDVTLKTTLSEKNKLYLNRIEDSNSIAIHFRRGDLLSRPVAVADQPSSTDDYYYNAVNIMNEKVNNPELFVFSDDIRWIEKNYKFDIPTTYINSDGPDYEHFNLMCYCKHQIIANSTFSWWAAWLNNNQEKIVISPKWWYRDPVKNESIIRIPQNWLVLNNLQ